LGDGFLRIADDVLAESLQRRLQPREAAAGIGIGAAGRLRHATGSGEAQLVAGDLGIGLPGGAATSANRPRSLSLSINGR
jgi:hypothetical protein